MTEFAAARQNMVDSQIRPNKVSDPAIVAVLEAVPREQFLPERLHGIAYCDDDIALGNGRYLMEPMVLARLLQEATPAASDVALIVGAATGYSVAVLAGICSTVVALESDATLVAAANKSLAALGIDNAAIVEGPLAEGCPAQGPFGVILFDGAVDAVPNTYFAQLSDGGRLVAVLAGDGAVGRATRYRKTDDVIAERTIFDAAIHNLPGFDEAQGFVF